MLSALALSFLVAGSPHGHLPFDPVGTWYSHVSFSDRKAKSAPRSIKEQLQNQANMENHPGWRLILRRDHTSLLPGPPKDPNAFETGTWYVRDGELRIICLVHRGKPLKKRGRASFKISTSASVVSHKCLDTC